MRRILAVEALKTAVAKLELAEAFLDNDTVRDELTTMLGRLRVLTEQTAK
jgi:hypothetical protein